MSRDISWFVDLSGAFKGCVVVQGQRVAICSYDNARRQAWGSSFFEFAISPRCGLTWCCEQTPRLEQLPVRQLARRPPGNATKTLVVGTEIPSLKNLFAFV